VPCKSWAKENDIKSRNCVDILAQICQSAPPAPRRQLLASFQRHVIWHQWTYIFQYALRNKLRRRIPRSAALVIHLGHSVLSRKPSSAEVMPNDTANCYGRSDSLNRRWALANGQ
jgi:hypothetical protein